MGEVLVPADALWGAQTQRAVENFPVSGERLPRELIGALASIKRRPHRGAQLDTALDVLAMTRPPAARPAR